MLSLLSCSSIAMAAEATATQRAEAASGIKREIEALLALPAAVAAFDRLGGRLAAALTGEAGAVLRPLQRDAVMAGCCGRAGRHAACDWCSRSA